MPDIWHNTPGEAVDAVLERVWQEYQRSGHLPDDWLAQIEAHGWRTGRPVSKDQVRVELVRALERRHRVEGYNPSKDHDLRITAPEKEPDEEPVLQVKPLARIKILDRT